MERRTLVESLMITDEIEVKTNSVYWKSIIFFLTFSLNPFILQFSKAINLSGIIPFSVLTIVISLLYYYMSSVVISTCLMSRATNYSELFNNYFHRMDIFANFFVFFYSLSYICLVQVSILVTILATYREIYGYDSQMNFYILWIIMSLFSICMILLSCSEELKTYYKACIVSLILLALTVVGASYVIYAHRDSIDTLMNCENYYYSGDFYLSIYIITVVVNIFQSLTLIYKDIIDSNFTYKKDSYSRSLKIAFIITIIFYLLFGFILSFTERITSTRAQGPQEVNIMLLLLCIFRLFKLAWLVLQVCLMMLTLNSSFVSIIKSTGFEVPRNISLSFSAVFIFVSIINTYYVYANISDQRTYQRNNGILCYSNAAYDDGFDYNEEDDYDPKPYEDLNLMFYEGHNLFIINAYCSIVVGLAIPWALMIRSNEYKTENIAKVGVAICVLLAAVVYANFYEREDFYFPV